jgi:hypothetical protein
MKKIFTIILSLSLTTTAWGQKLRKKQADHILQTALSSLKNGDSTAFVKLWYFDGTAAPYRQKPFTEQTAMFYFHYLKEFVDTALLCNLKIDELEISKVGAEQRALNFGKYNIKAWFKYNDNYFKGFGFFLDYIDDKWVVRYIPDTSTFTRG